MTKNAKRIMELIEQEDYDTLIEENKKLIYKVIHRYNIKITGYDKDDLEQIGMIALYKAAKQYNPERGEFSSYAMRAIINAYLITIRQQQREITPDLYLDDTVSNEKDNLYYKDFITYTNDEYKSREFIQALKEALNTLTERGRYAFIEREFKGRRNKDIAAELEMLPRSVATMNSRSKNYIKRSLIEQGITADYFEED